MSASLEITPKGRSIFKGPSFNVDGSASGQRPLPSQGVQPTPFVCRKLSVPAALFGLVGSWFVLLLTLSVVCCFSPGLFARPIEKIQDNSADTLTAHDSLHCSPSITISNPPDSLSQSDFLNPKWAGNWFRFFHIDVDSDGDPDLVAVARSWKLFVWLNDGRGHYRRHNFAGKVLTCAEESAQTSTVDGSTWLCYEPFILNLEQVRIESPHVLHSFFFPSKLDCDSRSPRPPPTIIL